MKTQSLLAIVLLYGLNITVAPMQNNPTISERVEKYIDSAEPAWKLERREDISNGKVFLWKYEKQRTDVSVITFASPAEAKDHLSQIKLKVTAPPKSESKDFGDETILYQTAGSSGCMLLIRKGEICISVSASECATAKKFAGHILKSIDTQ